MAKRKSPDWPALVAEGHDSPPAALAPAYESPPPKRTRTSSWEPPPLPPLSPLTETSDLENDLAPESSHPLTRNNSTRKRKAPPAADDTHKPSPKRQKKQLPANTPAGPSKRPRVSEPATPVQNWKWNLTTLASRKYAFVRLDERGCPTDDKGVAEAASYWWPAKVIGTSPISQVTVRLYGNDGSGVRRTLSFKAGEGNTLPFTHKPFTKSTFATTPDLVSRLEKTWVYACKSLSKDEKGVRASDDDGVLATPAPLPLPLPTFTATSPAAGNPKKRVKLPKAWSPPPADPAISVPGEKVLARMPRTDKDSWHYPAMVQKYIQPSGPNQKARYVLEFFNTEVYQLERNFFYLYHEEAFNTCKLGNFGPMNADDDDSDSELFPLREERASSPPPVMPTLPLPNDNGLTFGKLPLRTQFALIAPTLDAIITDQYAPARDRNRSFFKGRKARQLLQQTAGLRGPLSSQDTNDIRSLVLKWALQEERWARRLDDNGEVLTDQPSAQQTTATALPDNDLHSANAAASEPLPVDVQSVPEDSSIAKLASPRSRTESAFEALSQGPELPVAEHNVDECNTLALSLHDTPDGAVVFVDSPSDGHPGRSSPAFDVVSDSKSSPPPDSEIFHPLQADVARAEDGCAVEQSSEVPWGTPAATTFVDVSRNIPSPTSRAGLDAPVSPTNISLILEQGETYVHAQNEWLIRDDAGDGMPDTITSPRPAAADVEPLRLASPTSSERDNLATHSAWPPSSLPTSSCIPTSPTSQADVAVAPSPSSQADEVSPSATLPLAESSSPAAHKPCSQAGSPDSESAAETRVDEPSSSRRFAAVRAHRRIGCESYEALSRSERQQYCLDVLCYEAVIQILLWRTGKKTTTAEPMLDDAAEQALHDQCVEHASEQETLHYKWRWMDELKGRRAREDMKKPAPIVRETFGGKSLRPAAKQISYLE